MTASPGIWLALAAAAGVASAVLSGITRQYALARSVLDVPNERSLHSVATPRGGGAAVVIVVLAGILALGFLGILESGVGIALSGGGVLVAAVGWLDDRHGIPALPRLAVHMAAAAWALFWLRGMPELTLGTGAVHLGAFGTALALAAVVWATNLYNFMDGIDGLAGAEALVVGLAAAVLLGSAGSPLALVALLVAAAGAGFLPWNWPPARLFMGDTGSGFLGFTFGALAVASENAGALPALIWLVLLAPFFLDATVTLVRRMAGGERWYAAHRSHAYQRAVRAGYSHLQVTLAVAGLSVALGVVSIFARASPELLVVVLAGALAATGAVYVLVERRCPMWRKEQ